MASITLYNSNGESTGTLTLSDHLFAVKPQSALVHQAVVTQMANSRASIAHTKTRGEVRGTGKKPWKQKGTGRARHGSRRSPIWIGGGITFGPRAERNFSLKMNARARRKALAMVLTDKLLHNQIVAVGELPIETGKTKSLITILRKLPVSGKRTLVITEPENKTIAQAARNVQNVETLPAHSLNVVDLLRSQRVVMTVGAIELVEKLYKR